MKTQCLFLSMVIVAISAVVPAQAPSEPDDFLPGKMVIPNNPVVFLWHNGAPGSEDKRDEAEIVVDETVSNIHNPSLMVFLPPDEINTGVGLIVTPGGGHRNLWIMHEGYNVAQWFAARGVAAFVLKHRLARQDPPSGYTLEGHSLDDMKRAIRLVRSRAEEWGVNPQKIGAMGFSAGGELARLVATTNDPGDPQAIDPVERVGCRPDFQVLIYPGKSRRIQPTPESPPAFLAAGYADQEDVSIGLAEAYIRFKRVEVEAELHMYANTHHGFGLRPDRDAGKSNQQWPTHLMSFLRQIDFIETSAADN